MNNIDPRIEEALMIDMTVDITTIGRKSGQPRRIEIWAHYIDGRVFIAAMPGRRSWYANMLANPEFTFHLKQNVRADIPAVARPIRDEDERKAMLTIIKNASQFGQRKALNVEHWSAGSCLVEVTFA